MMVSFIWSLRTVWNVRSKKHIVDSTARIADSGSVFPS